MNENPVILASGSPFRATLLRNAGIAFEAVPSRIDERMVETPLREAGASPEDIALVLAEAKAVEVSGRCPGRVVIGSDQTLSLGDDVLHKVATMEEARKRLLALSGRTHHLNSAVVLARDGETIWRHVAICRMTMRTLTPAFVGRHLARVGDGILASVGAYQYEGEGIQLFEEIDGDYFSIVGLPLLPLLAALRAEKAIES